MDDQNRILAGLILNCKPDDLKGVALKADGSLAVVAPNGMKFVFSPVELDNARDSFCLPSAPLAESFEASRHTAHTPPTAPTSTSSVSGLSLAVGIPMAEPVEASGCARVVTSIPARQKSSCGIGAGSVTEAPMAEPVEAREHGAPNPPTSTSSVTGSGSAIGQASRRRRKEKRL